MNNLLEQNLLTAKIVDISWERIWLCLRIRTEFASDTERASELSFYLVNERREAKAQLQTVRAQDAEYDLRINITNPGNGLCLPTGKYSVFVCCGEDHLAVAEADITIVKSMADHSRNFLFRNMDQAYTVTFFVSDEDDEHLPLLMRTMISAKASGRRAFVMGSGFVKGIKRKLYRCLRKCCKNRTEKKVILFFSEQSDAAGSNLQAVRDRIRERGLETQYTILEFYHSSVTAKHRNLKSWFAMLKMLAKADFVFLDDHAPVLDWLVLDRGTKIIQLWHAGAGFKSAGYSRWGHMGCPPPYGCHRQYTYGIAGSKRIRHFFSEVWGISDAQVLPLGMPRIDAYWDEAYRKNKLAELYEQFPLCRNKKVILYAPTYRGTNKANAHYPYELIDFEQLYRTCGEDYVVLFKMHPWVQQPVPIPEAFRDRMIDANQYPNINDLFYFTELLISDYSSNIFEYSLMRRPMLFFAYDEIQYSFSRGFHRDYEASAPGRICHTFAEVLEAIRKQDFEYEKVERYVEDHFDYIDSRASDRVIDWILLQKLPEFVRQELAADAERNQRLAALDFKSNY